MTKYILIVQPEKRSRHHSSFGESKTEVHTFNDDLSLIKYIGNNKHSIERMSVYSVNESVLAQTFLTQFENKKRLALSKLTSEDQAILGIK